MKLPRLHRIRYNISGHARFLTFSCFHSLPLLSAERCCRWYCDAVQAARSAYRFDLWAYVIMPDHCHLLIYPHDPKQISRILYRVKKPVADRAVAWAKKHAPLFLPRMQDRQPSGKSSYRFWQRNGGYDRNILTTEEAHEKARYIHTNPVRAGLVESPDQWEWSSYRAWMEEIDEPIPIDRDSLPPLFRA